MIDDDQKIFSLLYKAAIVLLDHTLKRLELKYPTFRVVGSYLSNASVGILRHWIKSESRILVKHSYFSKRTC